MEEEMRASLPAELPLVFVSSVTQMGIQALKDLLWNTLEEENKKHIPPVAADVIDTPEDPLA
jgi:GTP-binding protein